MVELKEPQLSKQQVVQREDRDSRATRRMRIGSFGAGVALVICGVVDAAFNPFGFITAPQLIGFGIPLILAGTGKDKKEKSNE